MPCSSSWASRCAGRGRGAPASSRRAPRRCRRSSPCPNLGTGLGRAELLEAEIELRFAPAHAPDGTAEFGTVTGSVALGGVRHAVTAHGFAEDGAPAGPWPRLRAALDLGDGASLAL